MSSRKGLVLLAIVVFIGTFLDSPRQLARFLSEDSVEPPVVYSQNEIERTAQLLDRFVPRVLVFDGDRFSLHSLIHESKHKKDYPGSKFVLKGSPNVPMIVNALKTKFKKRFEPGSEPFQVLFQEGDSVVSDCINRPTDAECTGLAPILAFGSTPTDPDDMPSVLTYPNIIYTKCLYQWQVNGQKGKTCYWEEHKGIALDIDYDDLIPTIIWRGSDNVFLHYIDEYKECNKQRLTGFDVINHMHGLMTPKEQYDVLQANEKELPPRWKAVIMTIGADIEAAENNTVPWIDTRFADAEPLRAFHHRFDNMGVQVTGDYMTSADMSQYKYQIDYGGGGGTTWRGTLTKMKMPGVLFHHESRMKDWFYNLVNPWEHYIPVKWDLSDLREKYEWAEAHPEECRQISLRATQMVNYILSPTYMKRLHNELFVKNLDPIVKGYEPSEAEKTSGTPAERLAAILDHYHSAGFATDEVAECDHSSSCTLLSDIPSHTSHSPYRLSAK